MKFQPRCIDCSQRQGIRVYRLALEALGKEALDGKEEHLRRDLETRVRMAEASLTPAELSLIAIRAAERVVESEDPFQDLKQRTNELAVSLYPELKERIARSENPLYLACQLAACGNIIDLGIQEEFDIHATIEKVLREGFRRDDFSRLVEYLEKSKETKQPVRVLYLCDNAGEIGFDRLFIEELLIRYPHLQITAGVNRYPILNDATMEDASAVGLDSVVPVIDDGTGELGIVFSKARREFLDAYHAADLIISKGQANYETLSERSENLFYILKAKCEVIAQVLGVDLMDAVMIRSPHYLG